MVAYKSSAVPSFLKAPKPDCRAVLLYGPDNGLVTERADALAKHFSKRGPEPAEIVRLDDRDFGEDPSRLEVELNTKPMFAAQAIVRITAGAKLDLVALKGLLATGFDNPLIVEAGNLRPEAALRKMFEAHKTAAALPCYSDERALVDLIGSELEAAGLSIDRETRDYLMTRLGADQAMSRAEVAKLALYAQGEGRIGHDDIDAIVGDAAETALENFVYATSAGDARAALIELKRLFAAGIDRASALSALGRHFTQLHRVASAASSGASVEDSVRSLRPRPHFKREPAFIVHCKRWGSSRLAHALPLIQEATKRARLAPDLEAALAERLVLALTSKI